MSAPQPFTYRVPIAMPPRPAAATDPPLVSMLLIAYNQADSVAAAIAGALAQTYPRLEIVISDDASSDATWQGIQDAVAAYRGPHRLVLNRNPVNLGIGAHLSRLVALSHGELLFVAAGDDVSEPERCSRVVAAWLDHGRGIDLIASHLLDVDADGQVLGRIEPDDLSRWRGLGDWAARRPYVVGAAQAWTRRIFDRCGPLPPGVVAEDLIMVFRALGGGGAITLPEALVRYRRGGISRRVRARNAGEVVARLLKNNRHALVEQTQLIADARRLGQASDLVEPLEAELARLRCIDALFAADGFVARLRCALAATPLPPGQRLRLFAYAAMPWIFAPGFAVKRSAMRWRGGA